MDPTILPADAAARRAGYPRQGTGAHLPGSRQQKVNLTVIQDSCYSGSGARGALYSKLTERPKNPDSRYVEPFLDERGARLP